MIIQKIKYYFLGCHSFKEIIERVFYDFRDGIKNLIDWFFIIWSDRQWDHHYLTRLLHHKLYRMEKYFRNGNFYENQEKDADNMKICADSLKRIIDDNYDEIAFKEHDEKWGELNIDWGKENNSTILEDLYKLVLDYKHLITKSYFEKLKTLAKKIVGKRQADDHFELHELKLSRPNAITKEQKEQEHQEYMECTKKSEKMREDDLDLVFGTMRKELLRWWE
jgi:hypothetical protein